MIIATVSTDRLGGAGFKVENAGFKLENARGKDVAQHDDKGDRDCDRSS